MDDQTVLEIANPDLRAEYPPYNPLGLHVLGDKPDTSERAANSNLPAPVIPSFLANLPPLNENPTGWLIKKCSRKFEPLKF